MNSKNKRLEACLKDHELWRDSGGTEGCRANFKKDYFVDSTVKNRVFINVDFTGVSFVRSEIQDCQFISCIFNGADFSYSKINNTKFEGGLIDDCSFEGAVLVESVFEKQNLSESNFSYSCMDSIVFESVCITMADFFHTSMNSVVFNHSKLEKCAFYSVLLVKITEDDSLVLNPKTDDVKRLELFFSNVFVEEKDDVVLSFNKTYNRMLRINGISSGKLKITTQHVMIFLFVLGLLVFFFLGRSDPSIIATILGIYSLGVFVIYVTQALVNLMLRISVMRNVNQVLACKTESKTYSEKDVINE